VGTGVTYSQPSGLRRGVAASGSLEYLSEVVRDLFGKTEGDTILRISISPERIPHEPFTDRDVFDSVRAVVRERHPEWAARWLPEKA
jgi:hypothetical protein